MDDALVYKSTSPDRLSPRFRSWDFLPGAVFGCNSRDRRAILLRVCGGRLRKRSFVRFGCSRNRSGTRAMLNLHGCLQCRRGGLCFGHGPRFASEPLNSISLRLPIRKGPKASGLREGILWDLVQIELFQT